MQRKHQNLNTKNPAADKMLPPPHIVNSLIIIHKILHHHIYSKGRRGAENRNSRGVNTPVLLLSASEQFGPGAHDPGIRRAIHSDVQINQLHQQIHPLVNQVPQFEEDLIQKRIPRILHLAKPPHHHPMKQMMPPANLQNPPHAAAAECG